MNARLLIAGFAMSAALLCHAEDPPKAEQIERLVRASVFARTPDFNTNAEFKVRRLDVKGLWEEMKTAVVDVYIKDKDQSEPYEPYGFAIYHDGKLAPSSCVGYCNLLSGLVSNGEFYYTWEWGSGIWRSQVVRLRIVDGKLVTSSSVEFPVFTYQFLFVSAGPGGRVRVLSGTPVVRAPRGTSEAEFNHWEAAKEIGFVGETNSSALQIVDANGKVITPTDK